MLIGKARAIADSSVAIVRAAEKVGARTETEAQHAREQAAPAYIRDRVRKGEALPSVELVRVSPLSGPDHVQDEDREWRDVTAFVVEAMQDDLFVEFWQGIQFASGPAPPLPGLDKKTRYYSDPQKRNTRKYNGHGGYIQRKQY